jgi:hypothetical protein
VQAQEIFAAEPALRSRSARALLFPQDKCLERKDLYLTAAPPPELPHPAARAASVPGLAIFLGEQHSYQKLQYGEVATISSNSMHRVVKGATHTSVVYERSDAQATSAAIVEVVEAVRNDQPLTR